MAPEGVPAGWGAPVYAKLDADIAAHLEGNAFGCDICQDVCPWNQRFSRDATLTEFEPRSALASNDSRAIARDILEMDVERFRAEFKGSPMKRAKLSGLKRNAAVALGNSGNPGDVEALTEAAASSDTLLSEHASWALKRIRS